MKISSQLLPFPLFFILWIAQPLGLWAQNRHPIQVESIYPSPIQISDQMTTNLIFSSPIKSVDRGIRNIMIQKAKNVENILQVKADNSEMEKSNLTVITEDGSFYSFMVSYQKSPQNLNLKIKPVPINSEAHIENPAITQQEIEASAIKVAQKKSSNLSIIKRKFLAGIHLQGIYIDKDLLFLKIRLENQSNIPYDIEQFRLFIRDNKQSKRSASQELEQIPVLLKGNASQIQAQASQLLIVALPKFTIPNQKHLKIELMEEKGGRNLAIKVKNKHLLKTETLN